MRPGLFARPSFIIAVNQILTYCHLKLINSWNLGHFVCSECYSEGNKASTSTSEHKPRCYTCNCEIAYPPHRIYIDLEDLGQKPVDPPPKKIEIVDKLDAINQDTPAISVEKASSKIQKLCKREGNDPETMVCLDDLSVTVSIDTLFA